MSTPRTMSVQVQTGQLRSSPSFLGSIVTEVRYAQQVQVMEERAGWMRVSVPGVATTGWIHGSALSPRRIVLQAGDEEVRRAATTGEIALAGKGFNQEVEREFRTQNRDVDFSVIDRMQSTEVPIPRVQQFAREGQLNL
ncbi:SH3 domain-containing protein [Desulfonatronum thiosulfatophilum]|uniref:SH3 domain-containing protein n=1 Tax=Desulfonatronum thiosulfatophilum TaxID=617002 RepID=A0A1G6BX71_9BACT|nr:SH3 domain-containing protein [Desulfonatronum thiosulfatophilum]SDB25204.1 SH3 domain-containing protein [Desulfonatronum thiosulfatophilum]